MSAAANHEKAEGGDGREGRKGDQDQESAKFARLAFPSVGGWWCPRPRPQPPPQCLRPSPAVAVSRFVDVAFWADRPPVRPDRIAGRQSNLGDREKFLRLGEGGITEQGTAPCRKKKSPAICGKRDAMPLPLQICIHFYSNFCIDTF